MSVRVRTSPPTLLETATEVLVADPSASLADVARAAGIGRTTLHKLYPTRHALLVALARDALDVLERTYADAGLGSSDPAADPDPAAALRRLVVALVPLGPRVEYLMRERSLDVEPDLTARVEALDEPVRALVRRAQAAGRLRPGVPDEWVVASLNALVYAAWELVALGRLAPVAAPDLVLGTLLDGVRATGA
jgi:AcrR family transcriptional regulator